MFDPLHPSRQFPSGAFRERRLSNQHDIEKLPEQSRESPVLPEVEKPSEVSAEVKAVEEPTANALMTHAAVGAELTVLKDFIRQDQRATDAPKSTEKKEGEKSKESAGTSWYKVSEQWNTLAPETRSTLKAVGIGLGTALGVFLLAKLFKRAKHGVEVGTEKAKAGLSWLWGAFLVGAAGVAGYIGWKTIEQKVEKQISALGRVVEKVDSAVDQGREVVEKVIPNQETIDRVRQKADAASQEIKKDAEALAKLGAKSALASYIVYFHGSEVDWGAAIDDNTKALKIANVVSNLSNPDRQVKMSRLFAEPMQNLYTPPPEVQSDPADLRWHRSAFDVFVLFCVKHREQLKKLYAKHPERMPNLEEMTVKEFVEQGCGTYKILAYLKEQAALRKDAVLDSATWVDVEKHMSTFKDHHLDAAMFDLIPETLQGDMFRNLSATEVLHTALAHPGISIAQHVDNMTEKIQEIDVGESLQSTGVTGADIALYRICRHILDQPSGREGLPGRILQFFHGEYPESEFSGTDEERVRRYLTSDMSLSSAVRLALYDRMILRGNAMGYILAQAEILHFIRRSDTAAFLNSRAYAAATKLLAKLTPASLRTTLGQYVDNQQEVDAMILQITATLKPFIKSLLAVASAPLTEAAAAAVGVVEAGVEGATEWTGTHIPETLGIGTAGLVTSRMTGKFLSRYDRFVKNLEATSKREGPGKTLKYLTRSDRLLKARSTAAGALKELVNHLRAIHPHQTGSPGLDVLTKFLQSGRTAKNFVDFEREVLALCKTLPAVSQADVTRNVEAALRTFGTPDILKTIRHHRFFQRVISLPVRVGAGIPVRVATFTVASGAEFAKTSWELFAKTPWERLRGPQLAKAIGVSPYFEKALKTVKMTAESVTRVLSVVEMPGSVAKMFAGNYRLLIRLVGACRSGIPAVQRLVGSAAGMLRYVRLFPGLIMLDTYFALWEMQENGERIASTDDPLLKEVYAGRNTGSKGRIGLGLTSIAMPAVDPLLKTAGLHGARLLGMELAAGGAATLAGAVGIPAIAAAEVIRGKAEQVAETWLKNEKEWAKDPEGVLLQKLKDLGPGKHGYWQNYAYGTLGEQLMMTEAVSIGLMSRKEYLQWEENGQKVIEDANGDTRYKICRAIAIRTAQANLTLLSGESEEQLKRRFDQYVLDQMDCLRQITQGSFDSAIPDVFLKARRHADLMALSRLLQASKQEAMEYGIPWEGRIMHLEVQGKEVQFDLTEYADLDAKTWVDANARGVTRGTLLKEYSTQSRIARILAAIDLDSSNVEEFIVSSFLSDISLDLSRLEARLQSQDFPGLFWKDARSSDIARTMAFKSLMNALDRELASILLSEELTPRLYEEALYRISGAVDDDPMEYYTRGVREIDKKTLTTQDVQVFADRTDLFTVPALMQEMFPKSNQA